MINTKDLILQLAGIKENTKQEFFRKTGLNYSSFTGNSRKSEPSAKVLSQILLTYPDVNINWLLTGKGNMTTTNTNQEKEGLTHKEKITQYIKYKGLSKSKFCNICGFSNGYLDSKGSITSDKLGTILENFRDFNPYWLLLNEGEMILSETENKEELSLLSLNQKIESSTREIKNLTEKFNAMKKDFEELKKSTLK